MPTGASVGESVVADVLTSLREINGTPTYTFDVSQSVHQNANVLQLSSLPAVVVFDGGAPEGPGPNALVSVEHTLDIVCVVPASALGWQSDARRLMTDVAAKLREDWTRGGIALDTKIVSQELHDSDEQAAATPFGVGTLRAVVRYRHLYTDPTQAF